APRGQCHARKAVSSGPAERRNVVDRIKGRQPDGFSSLLECQFHCSGIDAANAAIESDRGKNLEVRIGVLQHATCMMNFRNRAFEMAFDDNASHASLGAPQRDFGAVANAYERGRGRMKMKVVKA